MRVKFIVFFYVITPWTPGQFLFQQSIVCTIEAEYVQWYLP